jgi:putative Holliday junction resolvase
MLPALLNEKDIIHRILAIVADRQVDTIVIGDPIREDGKPAKLSAEVHKFGARLEQMTGSKIVYVDERYSSVIALHRLHLAKEKKSRLRSKEKLDSGSACILLEDYLRSLK